MSLMDRFRRLPQMRDQLSAYVQIVLGCFIGALAYPLFLVPHGIAPGGLTGVTTILNRLFGLPVGITSLALNVPLFMIGWRSMGRVFALRSLIATVLFSFAIDLLRLEPMTADPLLATLYGGILLGAGLGLILRGGATTGGTDMIARMIHHRLPFITTGMVLFGIDCCVVLAACATLGTSEGLYALICIYASAKVIDMVMAGLGGNSACFIITDAWERVSQRILTDMERGATHLRAEGAFSHTERPVILCVVSRQEVAQIKAIVREEDEQAFVFITEAHEALGEGFSALHDEP